MTAPPITNPLPSDVLCGRGGGTNHHIGNSHWRNLVSANKRLYLTLPKRQKALVAKSIVHAIRTQNPPGRFLQKADDELWYDIGDKRACEKTSQALREGAPEIRTEMRDEKTNLMGPVMRPGQILPNGHYTVEANTRTLAQGVYRYVLESGGFRAAKAMVIVR